MRREREKEKENGWLEVGWKEMGVRILRKREKKEEQI